MTVDTLLDLAFPLTLMMEEDLSPAAAFVLSRPRGRTAAHGGAPDHLPPLSDREIAAILAEQLARGFVVLVQTEPGRRS